MPRIAYRRVNFKPATLAIIAQAREICESYAAQGYSLTLRQLYYQFVARDLLPNRQSEYKRLGGIVDDARYAGLIDWNHVVDRTRTLHELSHWGKPTDTAEDNARFFVESVMPQFRISKWNTQPVRVEVWIEKDALIDVIARPSNALDLPYFACRGYNSTSNAWRAAQRIESYLRKPMRRSGAERVVILHLGDHDPEGTDMTRDIEARFQTFLAGDGWDPKRLTVKRIALNMEQIDQYNPPPNPAKEGSPRFANYVETYGTDTSWELDALDPPTIDALIREAVADEMDMDLWTEAVRNEQTGRATLKAVAEQWDAVVDMLDVPEPEEPTDDEPEEGDDTDGE